MSGKQSGAAGMRLRRPSGRTPSEEEVRALEAEAERIASKAPGAFAAQEREQEPAPAEKKKSKPPPKRKVQITAYLPRDLRDELNRAAVALSGPPTHETVTSIVERAIRNELRRLNKEHGEFPETSISPRPGRRPQRG